MRFLLYMENKLTTRYFVIACIIASCFCLFYYADFKLPFVNLQVDKIKKSQEKLDMIKNDLRISKNCVLREIIKTQSNVWPILHKIINNCSFIDKTRKVPFIPLGTDKFFVHFSKNYSATDNFYCNVVTLGVGNEIIMEENLKKIYPRCNFYGADPFNESAQIYNKVGKVYVTAIDEVPGKMVLNTYRGGGYSWNEVSVRTFGSFLKNDLHINKVHFLSMDIEGSEYRLLPYLASNEKFKKESDSATICQISLEFHGPLSFYNYTHAQFEKLFVNFLSATQFVPIIALDPGNHHRLFAINGEDEYCLNLFF